MTDAKWMLNRAGLLNFWYYDDEIFTFSDGKLLLRGTNGSGKSVTMQSFLPVLLDGKKTPDRLDPFGSKARRMEDYLLGEKGVVDRDERTGYLFIEYKREGTEQYVTTGMGMQAKRHKGIKTWYFLITDNRRIGVDFELAHSYGGDKVPFSAKELENRIGEGGHVVHAQREYTELVNKYIFGFQSIEAYEDLIKLLIQLRSPKLSKDFKPTVIYEILESALPPLTDDELRHLSDTIENMDQTQQQLEQLEREYQASLKLRNQYHSYNQFLLGERAKQWQAAEKRYQAALKKVEELTNEDEELDEKIKQLETDMHHFSQQKHVADQEKQRLDKHEVWNLEEEKRKKQQSVQKLREEMDQLETRLSAKMKQNNRDWHEREKSEAELFKFETSIKDGLEELQSDAEAAAFPQHDVNLLDFERNQEHDFEFTVWLRESRSHEQLLASLKQLAEKEESLKSEHDRLQRQSSEKKREMDELRKEIDHLQQWFDEQKQQLELQVLTWIDRHPMLTISNQQRQEISRLIQGLYELNRYDEVRERLLSAIFDYEAVIKADKATVLQRKSEKTEEMEQAKADLHHWKTMKMPQPDRAEDTVNFREGLTADKHAFIPFYAAVEFQDHVTDAQRERLEAALKQIGLLDSLITKEAVSPTHDRIIQTEPMLLGHTLSDYLRPDVDEDSPISKQLVDEVLRSIPLQADGTSFHVDADGSYSVGCLIGHAPNEGPSKYIGRSSRKRFQQEKILECEEKLRTIQSELEAMTNLLHQYDDALKLCEEWKGSLPVDKDLSDLKAQLDETTHTFTRHNNDLKEIDQRWKEVLQHYQALKTQIHQQGGHLNLTLSLAAIENALQASGEYIHHLYNLDKVYHQCGTAKKQINDLNVRIRENEEEIDILKGEQNIKASQLAQVRAEIESIDQQLQLEGIEEIRARIRAVQQRLEEAERKIDEIRETKPVLEASRNTCQEKLTEAKVSSAFWSNMTGEWKRMVKLEIDRGFVEMDHQEAGAIVAELAGVLEKFDRPKLNEQLTKVFYNELTNLTEYRMIEYAEEQELPPWFAADWGDYYEPFIHEWEQFRDRRIIQMEYRGQRVSPYYVASSLEKELEDQRSYLDEQDRRLYEDIIVNTVGVILRNRIQRAEKWVREMDKIMESRDSSSGLTFSISWKPLTAESEQELDTKDLVELLQRNSKFLNEEDLNRITRHFQSKIEKAKELIQLRNEGTTLHQVLKEVLDYRKWFTFVLSYKRVNEPKRELTNNAFFKFSGGEKAMAMYIPLFTAAYSRYREAGPMAPYIISLDEAFAGVDENNIRDMFEVVEQLGFNYIMNSQALWGDYDTISSLSICELVRTKNADFVTVIRYHWDGKKRTLVYHDEPDKELVTNE